MKNVSDKPITQGQTTMGYWDAVIYNFDTACIKPKSIKIEFMDGEKQILTYGGYWYADDYAGEPPE